MAGRFSVEAVFKAVDKITAPVTRMQNRVGRMTRSMQRGFKKLNRTVGKVSAGIKKGAMASVLALGLLGAAVANVTDAGAQFGRAIGSAASKFPEQIQRGTLAFKELEDTAKSVGRTTEFTSVQAAKGLNFLAKAGFSAAFSMKALPDIVDFATASEIEFAEAADIASDALGAFGLDSTDAAKRMIGLNRVMDVMGKTANSANVVVAELFESVKKSAPVATAAGISIETYSATMGILAKNGIKASEAGTAAKNMMLSLAGVGFKAAKTFKKMNISLVDTKGELRDQLDVMDDLKKKLSTLTKPKQLAIMDAIFGKRALPAASVLLGKASKQVRILRGELEKSAGSNKKIAAFIRDDVKGSLDSLTSAVESVKISIFSLNEGPLKEAIDNMTKWIRTNEKLIAGRIGDFFLMIIENLDTIWTWIKRIGVALAIFQAFAIVVKTLNAILILTNLIMAANPIVLIVIAVIAAIAAVAALYFWWGKLNVWVKVFIGLIALALGPIGILIFLAAAIIKNWTPIMEFFKDLWTGIKIVTKEVAEAMGFWMGLAAAKIKEKWDPVFKFFSRLRGMISSVTKLTSSKIFSFFGGSPDPTNGGGSTDTGGSGGSGNMISPQSRTSKLVEESRTTSSAELTIKDDTGRAAVTKGSLGSGITLQPSGAF